MLHLTACGAAFSFMYLDLGKTRSLGLTSIKKNLGLASMKQELGFIKDIFRDNKMAEWVKVQSLVSPVVLLVLTQWNKETELSPGVSSNSHTQTMAYMCNMHISTQINT